MSKELKMLLWWSFFISVLATLYALVYVRIPIKRPVMWSTYVPLAIFFASGGNLKEIPGFALSAAAGFLWGIVCLWIMGLTAGLGSDLSLAAGVFLSVMGCCALHMGFARKTLINKCPMAFGGFAVCFATGGENGIAACLTMAAGLVLGGAMAYTGKWANKLAGLN
jgi:hypothetical protein